MELRALQMESVPEISRLVWISLGLEVIEVHIRQRLTHQPPVITRRMLFTREMFEMFGLTAQSLGCRHPANHTSRCRELIEKEPEGASKVARDGESQAIQA